MHLAFYALGLARHRSQCTPVLLPSFDNIAGYPGVVLKLVPHEHQKATYRLYLNKLILLDVENLSLNVVNDVLNLTYASKLLVYSHAAKNITVADFVDGVLFGLLCYEFVEGSALGQVVQFGGLVSALDNVADENVVSLVEALVPPLVCVFFDVSIVFEKLEVRGPHRFLNFLGLKNSGFLLFYILESLNEVL